MPHAGKDLFGCAVSDGVGAEPVCGAADGQDRRDRRAVRKGGAGCGGGRSGACGAAGGRGVVRLAFLRWSNAGSGLAADPGHDRNRLSGKKGTAPEPGRSPAAVDHLCSSGISVIGPAAGTASLLAADVLPVLAGRLCGICRFTGRMQAFCRGKTPADGSLPGAGST